MAEFREAVEAGLRRMREASMLLILLRRRRIEAIEYQTISDSETQLALSVPICPVFTLKHAWRIFMHLQQHRTMMNWAR